MLAVLVFAAVAGVQAQQVPRDAAAAPQKQAAALSGRITERGTDRGIPGALVVLDPVDGQERRAVLADDNGRYQFVDLAPGKYRLWAAAGDHRSTHLAQAFGQPEPLDEYGGRGPRPAIEMKPGASLADMDIALARALAIEGRVLDESERPMAGVPLVLRTATGATTPASNISSDDRGAFRLFGLKPGRYRVCADVSSGYVKSPDGARDVRTCYPAATSYQTAADVILATTDVTGIDIRVQRVHTVSVSGTILDEQGSPVDKAFVSAYNTANDSSSNTRSDHGEFTLDGLVAGEHIIVATVGGPQNPSDRRPPEREMTRVDMSVGDAGAAGVVLRLSKGRRISGRILFEGAGAPDPASLRLVVQAGSLDRRFGAGPPASTPVDERLGFQLSEVFPMPVLVEVSGVPSGWVLRSVKQGGVDITGIPTDIAARSAEPLAITLTSRIAKATVRVRDEQGAPVTAYRVVLLPADPARWKTSAFAQPPASVTADGEMVLPPQLPGEYLAAAIPTDEVTILIEDRSRVEALASVAARVTLREGDAQHLELRLVTMPTGPR